MDDQMLFPDRDEFRKWLSENHDVNKGIWLIFSKTDKLKTIKADEALEEALRLSAGKTAILITGSIFVAAGVRQAWYEKNVVLNAT